MIALNETTESAAEIPFYLPTIANPLVGLTGHAWNNVGGGLTNEVKLHLPTDGVGVFNNATIVKIVEVGFGWYCLRLTSLQTTTAGLATVRAEVVGSSQPAVVDETIGTTGGDVAVGFDGAIPFYLANSADPIFGAPVTGYAFSAGDVKVRLPNGTFVNADLADVTEVGLGAYQLALEASESDTVLAGKAFVYATATGAQRYTGWVTVLGTGVAVPVVVPPLPVIFVPVALAAPIAQDHVAIALSRLCEQFKSKNDSGLVGALAVPLT